MTWLWPFGKPAEKTARIGRPRGKSQKTAERDAAMVADRMAGASVNELMEKYGIKAQMHQIVGAN
jgi:Mor family transcriptional regulator